jgi:hypothetical protein
MSTEVTEAERAVSESLDRCGESIECQMDAAFKKAEARRYIHMFKWAPVAEDYIDAKVAMILDVVPRSKVEVDGTIATGAVRPNFVLARFILHHSARKSAVANYWDQQLVLVNHIEIVKGVDGVIPSTVGLYAEHNRFKHRGASDVYINAPKFSFELWPRLVEHKSCPLTNFGGIDSPEHSKPSVVQGRPEVVNSVSKNQGHFTEQSRLIMGLVLERLPSSCSIYLYRGNVTLLQRQDRAVDVGDMLLGPLQL